ncbi:MAG TPA: sulfatase [Thermoanaerobaculia bacterium]|nr:sulfatase [Thermoanaerobaculia bacterium]
MTAKGVLRAAGWLSAVMAATCLGCRPAAERRPDVIVYLVDTLRADHLGCYGYPRETSPRIDAFAAESVLFENAVAQSAWTRPAVTSILTGLDPHSHGVQERLDALPMSLDTLPEILRREGYQTAAFVSSAVITAKFGFDQGFDTFQQRVKETIEAERPTSEWVNEEALRWLEQRDPDRPFFLFLHTLDPHMPYQPPEPFRRRLAPDADPRAGLLENVVALRDGQRPSSAREREEISALYDAEIAANDAAFGRLIAELRARGLYDPLVLVFVSDHGEELLDHGGWEHGASLYQELIHVPLMLKLPGRTGAGRRIGETVRQVDVLPTLLDVLGGKIPPGIQGRSLLPLLQSPSRRPRRPPAAFSSLDVDGRRIESAILQDRKLIHTLAHDRRPAGLELYDLAADPGERRNLAAADPATVRGLSWLLEQRARAGTPEKPPQVPLDPELEKQLRALGYLR